MSTGEGQDPRTGPRSVTAMSAPAAAIIGVGGGDDSVSRIQLAARWAEAYGKDSDSLASVLKRFRTAYDYLDAVIHGVDPPELESEAPAAEPTAGGRLCATAVVQPDSFTRERTTTAMVATT